MNYGNSFNKGTKPVKSWKSAGANVRASKLNKGGDKNFTGGAKKKGGGKGKMYS